MGEKLSNWEKQTKFRRPKEKRLLVTLSRTWRSEHKQTRCGSVGLAQLAQAIVKRRAFENTVLNLPIQTPQLAPLADRHIWILSVFSLRLRRATCRLACSHSTVTDVSWYQQDSTQISSFLCHRRAVISATFYIDQFVSLPQTCRDISNILHRSVRSSATDVSWYQQHST
jgi:hypothetical protein